MWSLDGTTVQMTAKTLDLHEYVSQCFLGDLGVFGFI